MAVETNAIRRPDQGRMYLLLAKLLAWLVEKLGVAVLIVVLALSAYAMWLFIRDQQGAEQQRMESLSRLERERDRLIALKGEIAARVEALRADLAVQQQRVERAEKVLSMLKELESWWDRLFGGSDQQTANREQAARVAAMRAEAAGKLPELQRLLTHTAWEAEGAQASIARIESEMEIVRKTRSAVAHYVSAAWDRSKGYLALALGLYFFGPSLWKLFLYYGLAPWVGRGRPLRLSTESPAFPAVSESHVSVDVPLWPGEILRVKEQFLQASDEGLTRRTRFLLDWRIPFTSLACGLSELVEMRNGVAGADYRVTLSNADDPHLELAVIQVPAGSSIILRPRFLAGVVTPAEEPLRIARRWVLDRWLSWITLQFRFFEFKGPCRLVVTGSRGIRAENLAEREGNVRAARRTNQDATIGFTPNLEYLPVRAETFWGFFRDMNPLFDDLFVGPGLFLCQETSVPDERGKPGRFWSSVWNGVLKVFGL